MCVCTKKCGSGSGCLGRGQVCNVDMQNGGNDFERSGGVCRRGGKCYQKERYPG